MNKKKSSPASTKLPVWVVEEMLLQVRLSCTMPARRRIPQRVWKIKQSGGGPSTRWQPRSVSEQNKRAVPVPRALPLLLLGDTTDDALDVVPRPGKRRY